MMAGIDGGLFHALNRGAGNPFLDWLMPRLTSLHHVLWLVIPLVLLCAVLAWRSGARAGVWFVCVLLAIGLSDGLSTHAIKRVLHRDRPCHAASPSGAMADPGTRLVGRCPGSQSFPSNHAANTMAAATVCWWFTRRRGRWVWFLLPLVIGYTRVYLGYHYPSDVAGGWLVGALVGALVVAAAARLLPWLRPAAPVGRRGEGNEPALSDHAGRQG